MKLVSQSVSQSVSQLGTFTIYLHTKYIYSCEGSLIIDTKERAKCRFSSNCHASFHS